MGKALTADDILPLVACLTPEERLRLLRLVGSGGELREVDRYSALPATKGEFSNDEDSLSWDAEGWEEVG